MKSNVSYLAFAWSTSVDEERRSKGGARDCIGIFTSDEEARSAVEQWNNGGQLDTRFEVTSGQVASLCNGQLTLVAEFHRDLDDGLATWKEAEIEPKEQPKFFCFAHELDSFDDHSGSRGGMGDFLGSFVKFDDARQAVQEFRQLDGVVHWEADTFVGHIATVRNGKMVIIATFKRDDVDFSSVWCSADGKPLEFDEDFAELLASLEAELETSR
jgi:hypothetical protein